MSDCIIATFTGNGGRQIEQDRAHQTLHVGHQYVVVGAEIGGWHTDLILDGVEGKFNSCLFDVDWDQVYERYGDVYY